MKGSRRRRCVLPSPLPFQPYVPSAVGHTDTEKGELMRGAQAKRFGGKATHWRIAAVVVSAGLGAAACGGGNSKNKTSGTTSTTAAAAAEETTTTQAGTTDTSA